MEHGVEQRRGGGGGLNGRRGRSETQGTLAKESDVENRAKNPWHGI